MSKVTITENAIRVIREEGENIFPNECCGFLYGKEKNGRLISQAIPVVNAKEGDKRRRFEITPLDYLNAERYALENDLELLGVYHSHPDHPAIASEHDLKVALPHFSYFIVSVLEGNSKEIFSWKLKDEKREFLKEEVFVARRQNA